MSRIRNIVLDMGNVLFDYNPKAMTDYFLPDGSKEVEDSFCGNFLTKRSGMTGIWESLPMRKYTRA